MIYYIPRFKFATNSRAFLKRWSMTKENLQNRPTRAHIKKSMAKILLGHHAIPDDIEERISNRIWTVPNAITSTRIILTPVLAYYIMIGEYKIALAGLNL